MRAWRAARLIARTELAFRYAAGALSEAVGSASWRAAAEPPDQQSAQHPYGNQNLLLRGGVERVRHVPQADAQPREPGPRVHSIVLSVLRVVSRYCDGVLATFQGEIVRQPRQRFHRVCHPVERLDGQAATVLTRPEEDDDYCEDPNQPPLRGIRAPHNTAILRDGGPIPQDCQSHVAPMRNLWGDSRRTCRGLRRMRSRAI
jgi:hypothetical protein